MQYNFDPSQYDPSQLPDALPHDKYLVAITREEDKATKPGTREEGRAITFFLTIEQGAETKGTYAGREQRHQMNLVNQNETTVRIANSEMSRFAHVTGFAAGFQDTRQMFNIRFWVEIAPQKNDPRYSEVIKWYDINGNEPKLTHQTSIQIAPASFPAPAAPAFATGMSPAANVPLTQGFSQPAAQQPWGVQAPANPMQVQFAPNAGTPAFPSPGNAPAVTPFAAPAATVFPSSPTPAVPGAGWQQGAPQVKAPWAK